MTAAAAPATPDDLCAGQAAAVQALKEKIAAHNAQPHVFTVPQQQAAADAYDAEASALNGQKGTVVSQLQDCLESMAALEDAGAGDSGLKAPSQRELSDLAAAKGKIPNTWKPPPSPATPRNNWRVPPNSAARPLFDVLRKGNPGNLGDVNLQGSPRPQVGAQDPAYPSSSGRVIELNRAGNGPAVSADHIIPLAELINTPGFTSLTPQNMYVVTRAPLNFQWISESANLSKQSRSAALVTGADPQWANSQVALENTTRQQLQDIISKLLKSQGSGS